jgi:hypothetical protein
MFLARDGAVIESHCTVYIFECARMLHYNYEPFEIVRSHIKMMQPSAKKHEKS